MKVCAHGHGPLKSIIKEGIEIDYCPKCGGVWLDHGELEKLLEMASNQEPEKDMSPQIDLSGGQSSQSTRPKYDDDDHEGSYRDPKHKRRKKRDGFLDDIFDFDFFG